LRNLTSTLAVLFFTVLGGLFLMFAYRTLLALEIPYTGLFVAAGYLLLGTAMGRLVMYSTLGLLSRLSLMLFLSLVSAAFTWFMLAPLVTAVDVSVLADYHEYLLLIWPSTVAVGYSICGFRSLAVPAVAACPRVTDEAAHTFATRHGLLVEGEALVTLRSRSAGLKCNICCADHADQTDNWLFHWLRCPRSNDHLFHAWHFRDEQWRCPICRAPIYTAEE